MHTHDNPKKDPFLGPGIAQKRPASWAPIRQRNKAANPVPDEECRRPKPLRVRKTVQNRCIDLLATDSDRRNWRRRHTSSEVSP